MGFVDLMSNDVWTDSDITNRTESMIRSKFSVIDEQVLNRKIAGSMIGSYTLTDEDKATIAEFTQVTTAAQQAGVEARNDVKLLADIQNVEAAEKRLAQPTLDPEQNTREAVAQDTLERNAAQEVVSSASPTVMEWVEKRRPPPPPAPEPLPVEPALVEQSAEQPSEQLMEQTTVEGGI